jgi:DNA-binding SARP family transcriptional activator/tetratricopeptide (TPR) repeat protein
VAVLGPLQATLDGLSIDDLTSDRLRALLAFLAVESARVHPRQAVASLLWPKRPDREALRALRYALSNLRGALGDRGSRRPFLLVTHTTLQFNPASDHWLDVAEFEGLRVRSDVSSLERAASLYRGPFLDGLSVGDSPAFDEWMLLTGEAYRRKLLSVLGHLTVLQMSRGEASEAARWARRQLELEPYREQAHRQLMMALALGGERAAALAHYEACRRMLAGELGCEPDDETQALYAQIGEGGLSQPWTQPQHSPDTLSAPERTRSLGSSGEPSRTGPIGTTAGQAPAAGSGHTATVVGARPAHFPPPTRSTWAGRAPSNSLFVAREHELARLHGFLERALNGQGGVALIKGDAGSGKTALMDTFARQATQAHGDLIALRGDCNAHAGAGDPYLPFREMLKTLAGDVESKRAGGTLSPGQAQRLWETLPTVAEALAEHGPDLIDRFVPGEPLLRRVEGFPTARSGGPWLARLRATLRRNQESTRPVPHAGQDASAPQADLFAQVTQVLRTVAISSPLLLSIDDLQWADGGTAALLFHLGRRLAGSHILLVCAFRPEALREPPDPGSPGGSRNLASVLRELTRDWGDVLLDLDEADGRAFVEAYLDAEPNRLGAAFRQALYDHTGGNPLFTVELLRSFERGGALVRDEAGQWIEGTGLDWAHWPPQVQAVIAGHMAGLRDQDRLLLQVASVQGEQFTAEVVARVLGRDEEAVARRLSGPLRTRHRLVEAISLNRLPSSGQRLSRYRFRHALLERSAYASLDVVARARLHEATARALEVVYAAEGEQPQALAPNLARHYERAGMPLEAARQRLAAGQWAAKLVAYEEAIAHLQRGLALLEDVPSSPERLRIELDLCTAISTPVMLQRGWEAPVHAWALERLSELCQHPQLQDDSRCVTALSVLSLASGWSADPERAQRVGEQLLSLAQEGDRQSLMLAHWALGFSYWLRGQLAPAREHLEQALALYDPEASRPLGGLLAADPGVMAHSMFGCVLWLLGYPVQGRAGLGQAVAHAEALDHPSSVAFAHYLAAMVTSVVGRDVAAALNHAETLRSLGQISLVYGVWAELLAELAQASDGRGNACTAELGLEHGLARAAEAGSTWQTAGSGAGYAGLLLVQAQVCARAGQAHPGLGAMDQARAWVERSGVQVMEAEVWRMRGDLLLMADDGRRTGEDGETASSVVGRPSSAEEAQTCFQRALDVARDQGARWLELRAAVSLARLWQGQGRRDEARELLDGIYDCFTEGFDTPDLVEAKALLEQLERAVRPDRREKISGSPLR